MSDKIQIELPFVEKDIENNWTIFLITEKLYGLSHQVSPAFTINTFGNTNKIEDDQIKLIN